MAAYGTNSDMVAWLAAQGLTLPVGANVDVLRQIGSNYVDAAYEARLQCSSRTGGFMQELAWPRTAHVVNGQTVPNDLIPPAWIHAAYRAAWLESQTPGWATGSTDPNRVTRREKVDVIEREFFNNKDTNQADSAAGMAADAIINGMVLPFLCAGARRLGDLFRVI